MNGLEGRPFPSAVLFACGYNSIRSPMAAAIARHFLGRTVYIASAGVRAGDASPFAAEVMREIGIPIDDHLPHTFEDLHDTSFDLVVSLSPEAHHRALELTRTMAIDAEYWPTPDPSLTDGNREQRLEAYRNLRDALMDRIAKRFARTPVPNA